MRILRDNLFLNDVINIGSEDHITIVELAELVIRVTQSKSKIEFLPPLKEGDMSRRQPDGRKMRNILNRNLISLEEGLKKILSTEMAFLKVD
jgi:UDP-glucose 4-epimerase